MPNPKRYAAKKRTTGSKRAKAKSGVVVRGKNAGGGKTVNAPKPLW